MTAPRVFEIAQLAQLLNATIHGPQSVSIKGVAPIASAEEGELTYLVGGNYRKYLNTTKASAVILSKQDAELLPDSVTALVVKNPEVAFAKIIHLFYPTRSLKPGIHPSAVIGENCNIAKTAVIGANCVIEDDVAIGERTIIKSNTVIGENTTIGDDCIINSNVTLYRQLTIGNRVILHSGVVIGGDGFGYAQEDGQWLKIPQIGGVIINDDVEIGSNTTVDRGALSDTIIHRGVKIDNLVQVGHNVEIGEYSIIAGCVGIAGSVKIGSRCMIGGACSINGHLTIADRVILTGTCSVVSSIEKAGIYSSGINARPHREWVKTIIRFSHLDETEKRITQLEKLYHERNE